MTDATTRAGAILRDLERLASPANVAGMARYGITSANVLGVRMTELRTRARGFKRDHELALALWDTGVYEARLLAAFVDDSTQVTSEQMETWAAAFDSWALCDGVCGHLFDRTSHAVEKAFAWAERDEEYVKRAGFVLMATLAVHDKRAPDDLFVRVLDVVERHAQDPRNFVKKAVNWALRHVGKRNMALNEKAVATARLLAGRDDATARWVGRDALRELTNPKTLERIRTAQSRRRDAARSRSRRRPPADTRARTSR